MKHFCDNCGKSIKEVGRLEKHKFKGKHSMWLCNNCYNEKSKGIINKRFNEVFEK